MYMYIKLSHYAHLKKSHLHLKYTQLLFVAVQSLGCVRLFETPWTVSHQAPLSMGFSRQEYRSGLPFPSPGDLPDLGIEPASPVLADGFFTTEPAGKPSKAGGTTRGKRSKRVSIRVLACVGVEACISGGAVSPQ